MSVLWQVQQWECGSGVWHDFPTALNEQVEGQYLDWQCQGRKPHSFVEYFWPATDDPKYSEVWGQTRYEIHFAAMEQKNCLTVVTRKIRRVVATD